MKICSKCNYGNSDYELQCRNCGSQLPITYPQKKTEFLDLFGIINTIFAILLSIVEIIFMIIVTTGTGEIMLFAMFTTWPLIIVNLACCAIGYDLTRKKFNYYRAIGAKLTDFNKVALITHGIALLLRFVVFIVLQIIGNYL